LLADCEDTRCGVTSRHLALFSGSFCCCLTTIFTVVLTNQYVISTAAMSGPATYVRCRGCRAGLRAKHKQTLSADRTCPQPSSPAPSDHVSSSAVLGCLNVGHFCASTTTSSSCVETVESTLLCLNETWHDADSAVLGRLRLHRRRQTASTRR